MMTLSRWSKSKQKGITLIEILVTVLVLSIGALSMSSLQMRSVKTNQDALSYSLAVIQLHSISDALHVAREDALEGHFNIALGKEAVNDNSFIGMSLFNWRHSIRTLLGDHADSSIHCNDTVCELIVTWVEAKEQNNEGQISANSVSGSSTSDSDISVPKMVRIEVQP